MRTSCAVLPSAVAPLTPERQYFSEAARRIAGADYVVALPLELDCNEICAGTHSWSYDDNRSREARVSCERRGVTWTRTTLLGTDHRLGPAGAMRQQQLLARGSVQLCLTRVQVLTSDASCFGRALTRVRKANGVMFSAVGP